MNANTLIYVAVLTQRGLDNGPFIYAHASEAGLLSELAADIPTMIFGENTDMTIEPTERAIRHALKHYADGWYAWELEITTTSLKP